MKLLNAQEVTALIAAAVGEANGPVGIVGEGADIENSNHKVLYQLQRHFAGSSGTAI